MIREAIFKVNEASEYTNISIKNADKVINEKNVNDLLSQKVEIYGKYDGTKLSIFRTDKPWNEDDWTDMFIVSYKGNVIYPEEFYHLKSVNLDKSIGVSQYSSVIKHVEKYFKGWKSIPKNTEFFCEFLMNKPTLTRSYTKLRELILIGTAKVNSYTLKNGKIVTHASELDMSEREKWAKVLKINVPELLFKGKLKDLPKGLNDRASEFFVQYEDAFKVTKDPMDFWFLTKNFFLSIPSLYGSEKEEGVVIQLSSPIKGNRVLKIVQDDQYDKELRYKIKMKYRMDDIKSENEYWKRIREEALKIIDNLDLSKSIRELMKDLSKEVYQNFDPTFTHSKKDKDNIKDDLFLTAKNMIIKRLPGNNGALVIGKFRVFTNGHKKMFDRALATHDYLVVALVSNKETKKTLKLREEMIKAVFPGVDIIHAQTGNLITIINKSKKNINTVFAGSDRIESYKNQLKRNLDISVQEVKRTDEDESATKVIRNLKDFNYFKLNTPQPIHKFYEKLIEVYGINENFRNKMLKEIVENIEEKSKSTNKKFIVSFKRGQLKEYTVDPLKTLLIIYAKDEEEVKKILSDTLIGDNYNSISNYTQDELRNLMSELNLRLYSLQGLEAKRRYAYANS